MQVVVELERETADVGGGALVRAAIDVPRGWTISGAGRQVAALPDVQRYVGDGFVPNVVVAVSPAGGADASPPGAAVLSDRLVAAEDGSTRRTRVLLGEVNGVVLMFSITGIESGGSVATVTSTATESQWDGLADVFDGIGESARWLGEGEVTT